MRYKFKAPRNQDCRERVRSLDLRAGEDNESEQRFLANFATVMLAEESSAFQCSLRALVAEEAERVWKLRESEQKV
jgi:hypothetical protein